MDAEKEDICPCCLRNGLSYYLKIADMTKLLQKRAKAQTEMSCEIASFELPTLLGTKGYANYVFDFTNNPKDQGE